MGTNEVFAISNKPGEVTLKGFNYIKDRLPHDFEVCLIVEKDGHLSAGCWDTGVYGTISVVDGYGTFGQAREVSYDIMGFDCNEPESRILFKHIEESKVQRFEEMLDESL